MMHWLLKHEGYPPSIVFTVLLHGGLLLFIIGKQLRPEQYVAIEQPAYIVASTIKENPQRLRRLEDLRLQQQKEQQARQREQERKAAAERQRQAEAEKQRQVEAEKKQQAAAEKQRQADAEKKRVADAETKRQADAEAERQRVAETERRQAEAERQRQAAAEAERVRQQQDAARVADEAAAAQADLVSQYVAIIRGTIQQNWKIPPSARNGMVAVVEIRTTPIGDIISSNIIQSSGDPTFDRSVDQAVKGAGSFPELKELPNAVYERNFRSFTLKFSPEDLLR